MLATSALMPTAAADSFHFTVTADNRSERDAFRHVLAEISRILGGPGDFHVSVGDVDPPQGTLNLVKAAFGPDIRWVPVVGNHEAETAADMRMLRALGSDVPGLARRGPPGSETTTYSFDHGSAHIVVLNLYARDGRDTGGGGTVDGTLLEWLDADLSATDRPARFVLGHECAYPFYRHVGKSMDSDPVTRDLFWQVLERHEVAAFLCAHTHVYSRFRPAGSRVWQVDLGNAGRDSGGDVQTFMSVRGGPGEVSFEVWRGARGRPFAREAFWKSATGPDNSPPDLLSAEPTGDPRVVKLRFDEPLDGGGLDEPSIRMEVAGRKVVARVPDASGNVVNLVLDRPLPDGDTAEVLVEGVSDRAGNLAQMQEAGFVQRDGVRILVDAAGLVRYFRGLADPGAGWNEGCFDDSAWRLGYTGIGYGDDDDATRLDDMAGRYVAVYLRAPFAVGDPAGIGRLTLSVDYDDGFAAYLNGVAVARRNVPEDADHLTPATASREAGKPEYFLLEDPVALLRTGRNVLALELRNVALDSSDASIIPCLVAEALDAGTPADIRALCRPGTPLPAELAGCSGGSGASGPWTPFVVMAFIALRSLVSRRRSTDPLEAPPPVPTPTRAKSR
jgi:hypothetical protein